MCFVMLLGWIERSIPDLDAIVARRSPFPLLITIARELWKVNLESISAGSKG